MMVHTDTQMAAALRFITCGSVDDGKSTLIGRLLLDSRAVLQDQLASVTSLKGEADLARLTDGLSAEREQGITIDVAWRYFSSARRKFIIGDAPGHEQYTRNMITAASNADAAVVLIDATKLDWQNPQPALLAQTRRHSLLAQLLRVPAILFAVNKLDAVSDPALAFAHIAAALRAFAQEAGFAPAAIIPISALLGHNVVLAAPDAWAGYAGPSLLQCLEGLPAAASVPAPEEAPAAFAVQWVQTLAEGAAGTAGSRRILWGRVAAGRLRVGQSVRIAPGQAQGRVVGLLDHVRRSQEQASTGQSAGVVLDEERDASRGDWLLGLEENAGACWPQNQQLCATIAWMDAQPLQLARSYWALHGHRWIKARVQRIAHCLNIHTLEQEVAHELQPGSIGQVELLLQEAIPAAPYAQSRQLGSLILVDSASHATAAAVMLHSDSTTPSP